MGLVARTSTAGVDGPGEFSKMATLSRGEKASPEHFAMKNHEKSDFFTGLCGLKIMAIKDVDPTIKVCPELDGNASGKNVLAHFLHPGRVFHLNTCFYYKHEQTAQYSIEQ